MPGKPAARSPLSSWALALLCLIASLAFATRETGLAPMPNMDVFGMDMAAGHEHHAPKHNQHDHAGHCPFCFTAAFALEAGNVRVIVPATRDEAPPTFKTVPHLLEAVRGPQARAPPILA